MVPVWKLVRPLMAIGLAIASVLGWRAWNRVGDGPPPPRTERQGDADRPVENAPPELVMLQPGTVLGEGPPAGWSERVIQSILHLASGDVNTLPASAKVTATKFRTVVLADVRRDGSGTSYRLGRVGIGLSMVQDGRDVVISSATLGRQGVSLSTIDSMVFGRAEKALGRSHLLATTPTFALYETFVELADESGKHRSILLRYALLVDPRTGALQTACWPIAEDPKDRAAPEAIVLLPPDLAYRCGIHVLARRIAGVVIGWGFAMTDLPAGARFPAPTDLRSLLEREAFDPDEAAELEGLLREVLRDQSGPRPGSKDQP